MTQFDGNTNTTSSRSHSNFPYPLPLPQSQNYAGTRVSVGSVQNSSKNSSVMFCRICHEGESGGERLISPCKCSGSVGLIHRSCIEKWLSTANHDTCELCHQKYSISRHPRPFSTWLCEPAVGDDQRNLVGDGVCFLLLTPLAGISAYLCASGAAFYFEEKKSEAIGLICLSSLLVTIYLAWLVLTIRYHCQVWFKWRSNNQDVRLLEVYGQLSNRKKRQNQRLREQQPPVSSQVLEDVEANNGEVDGNKSSQSKANSQTDLYTDINLSYQENLDKISVSSSLAEQTAALTAELLKLNTSVVEETDPEDDISVKCAPILPTIEPVVVTKPTLPVAGITTLVPTGITTIVPLSPNIISHDPQAQSQPMVLSYTDDSEIYANLSATFIRTEGDDREITTGVEATEEINTEVVAIENNITAQIAVSENIPAKIVSDGQYQSKDVAATDTAQARTGPAPCYIPALKEHFMTVKLGKEPGNTLARSRGSFSPVAKFRSSTLSSL